MSLWQCWLPAPFPTPFSSETLIWGHFFAAPVQLVSESRDIIWEEKCSIRTIKRQDGTCYRIQSGFVIFDLHLVPMCAESLCISAASPTGHPQGGDEDRHCPPSLHSWTAARRVAFSADVNEPHPQSCSPAPFIANISVCLQHLLTLLLCWPPFLAMSLLLGGIPLVLPVPFAALQGWGATGPSKWGCTWGGERVLRRAQTSDPEDPRDPSLWDPRLSLETHLFLHTELPRSLRGIIASSPPA